MRHDNEQLSVILQNGYNRLTGFDTLTEVPEHVYFEVDGSVLRMKYSKLLDSESLNGADSFEGWAIICRRFGMFEQLIFDWAEPVDKGDKGYQEFLFRVKHFAAMLPDWFILSEEAQHKLEHCSHKSYVCSRRVLESIIEIVWYFEMSNRIKVILPENWEIEWQDGAVALSMVIDKPNLVDNQNLNEEPIYNPWRLLMNRWCYLPTINRVNEEVMELQGVVPELISELIRVGYAERNFPNSVID